jgi:hypothetical protein
MIALMDNSHGLVRRFKHIVNSPRCAVKRDGANVLSRLWLYILWGFGSRDYVQRIEIKRKPPDEYRT